MLIFLLLLNSVSATLFHEASVRIYKHNSEAEYFGYSVLLKNKNELIVGAPKAFHGYAGKKCGAVFLCPIDVDSGENFTLCRYYDEKYSRGANTGSYYKALQEDMWLGASLASIADEIIVGAPRWYMSYKDTHYLLNGQLFVFDNDHISNMRPLSDWHQQVALITNPRKDYFEYKNVSHLNFYAYGQAGISIGVTKDEKNVIIGAPGVMQWTGSLVHYRHFDNSRYRSYKLLETPNTYYTEDLGLDNYFGISVASGIFERGGKSAYISSAPRSINGMGMVLIFAPPEVSEHKLSIYAKIIGEQLGSYFGASLCVVDFDNDGISDLLVGAPNFVNGGVEVPFDQGAVFVYLSKIVNGTTLIMEPSGHVTGSRQNGARFGTSIANLGDVDGDGYPDVAIGAPFEDEGAGAVYIYKGSAEGLRMEYLQRITTAQSRGFGYSISKGILIDGNSCNYLAVGAFQSANVFVYRCIQTMYIETSIDVPNALDLPQNATNFQALFCIRSETTPLWPNINITLKATITVDREAGRAYLSDDPDYEIDVTPGQLLCEEKDIEVSHRADLSRPIQLLFSVQPLHDPSKDDSKIFSKDWARLSVESKLHSSFHIQLTRDCGEDLICQPVLEMSLESLSSIPYIPGSGEKLGIKVTVINTAEPAYGFKVNITLPSAPVRIPGECIFKHHNMTCEVPDPLHRKEQVAWLFEIDYIHNSVESTNLTFKVDLWEPLGFKKKDNVEKELTILIVPEAKILLKGKTLGNDTLTINSEVQEISFTHFIEVTNYGPSNWPKLQAEINIHSQANLSNTIDGCILESTKQLNCVWSIPANVSKPIFLPMKVKFNEKDDIFNENRTLNIWTNVFVAERNININITTSLILEPSRPFWSIIVGAVFGLLLLSSIFYLLHRCGFFSRTKREELRRLKSGEDEASGSGVCEADNLEAVEELLSNDSD